MIVIVVLCTDQTYASSRPSTCQALLLLSYREIGIGAMAQAWLYVGMAVRMVSAFRPITFTHDFMCWLSGARPRDASLGGEVAAYRLGAVLRDGASGP